MVVLLSCPPLAVVLRRLLKLDALESMFRRYRLADAWLNAECVCVNGPAVSERRVVAVNCHRTVKGRARPRREQRLWGLPSWPFVSLRRVLDELDVVLLIVRYDCRDAHRKAQYLKRLSAVPRRQIGRRELDGKVPVAGTEREGANASQIVAPVTGPFALL